MQNFDLPDAEEEANVRRAAQGKPEHIFLSFFFFRKNFVYFYFAPLLCKCIRKTKKNSLIRQRASGGKANLLMFYHRTLKGGEARKEARAG
jgi:hypothetical protein